MAHVVEVRFKTDIAYTEGQFAEAFNKVYVIPTTINKSVNNYTVGDVACLVGGWFFMATGSTIYTLAANVTNYVYAKVNLTTDGTNYTATTGNIQVSTSPINDSTTAKYRLIAKVVNNDATGNNISVEYSLPKDLTKYNNSNSLTLFAPTTIIPTASTGNGTKIAFTQGYYKRGDALYQFQGGIKLRNNGVIKLELIFLGALANYSLSYNSTVKIQLYKNGAYYSGIRNNMYGTAFGDVSYTVDNIPALANDLWEVYILNYNTGQTLTSELIRFTAHYYPE